MNLNLFLSLPPIKVVTLAQLVEQWTENPCVPGSIPGGDTNIKRNYRNVVPFFMKYTKVDFLLNYAKVARLVFLRSFPKLTFDSSKC